MHLLRLSRPALIAALSSRVRRRYRSWLEEPNSKVTVAGMFRPSAGRWYMAVRIRVPYRVPAWFRIYELRNRSTGLHEIVVIQDQPPRWSDWVPSEERGDNPEAAMRLCERAIRHGLNP